MAGVHEKHLRCSSVAGSFLLVLSSRDQPTILAAGLVLLNVPPAGRRGARYWPPKGLGRFTGRAYVPRRWGPVGGLSW